MFINTEREYINTENVLYLLTNDKQTNYSGLAVPVKNKKIKPTPLVFG
jgi:hypothetical protein